MVRMLDCHVDCCHPCSSILSPPPSFLVSTDTIKVDVVRPERNREVEVYKIDRVSKNGKLHNLYEIVIYGGCADVSANRYKAFLYDNLVFVQMPASNHIFLEDVNMFNQATHASENHCSRTKEAHDHARDKINNDKKRKTKLLVLKFPDDENLTNSIFSPKNPGDGVTQLILIPFKTDEVYGAKTYTNISCRVSWKISIVASEDRVIKETPEVYEGADLLMALLASTKI